MPSRPVLRKSWLESDSGKVSRYRDREYRRARVVINDVEPGSNRMRAADCDRFQTLVLKKLAAMRKRSFRGDLALRLDLETTSATPPHTHTIAKKLLDLLGHRRSSVVGRGRYVLYRDDSQVQALAVYCRHGEDSPLIRFEARSMASMREDLQLANEAIREADMSDSSRINEEDRGQESLFELRALIRDERGLRLRWGDAMYSAMVKICQFDAQGAVLRRSMVDISALCAMYGRTDGKGSRLLADLQTNFLAETPLRLQVGELPVRPGESSAFRERIKREVATFRNRWGWVLEPLLVPVGLEVVIRPDPETPPAVLHDLDNVVGKYLIPQIVPSFGIVSDYRWMIDSEELRTKDPEWAERHARKTPPKGTRGGVYAYQAWRVPAAKGQPSFVSVALVDAEDYVRSDPFALVDSRIEDWITSRVE